MQSERTYKIVPDDAEVLVLEPQQQALLHRVGQTVWFDPFLAVRTAAKREETWGIMFHLLAC